MKEVIDEIDKVKATVDPERLREECVVLNVNGDCLDHLEWDKGLNSYHFSVLLGPYENIPFGPRRAPGAYLLKRK